MNSNGENLRENSPIIAISCQIDQASGARPHNLKKPQINPTTTTQTQTIRHFSESSQQNARHNFSPPCFWSIAELQRSFKPILSNNELN
jgi:hypothetical protein